MANSAREQALQIVLEDRKTHEKWRDYWRDNPPQTKEERARMVATGTVEWHEREMARCDLILEVLHDQDVDKLMRQLRDGADGNTITVKYGSRGWSLSMDVHGDEYRVREDTLAEAIDKLSREVPLWMPKR